MGLISDQLYGTKNIEKYYKAIMVFLTATKLNATQIIIMVSRNFVFLNPQGHNLE